MNRYYKSKQTVPLNRAWDQDKSVVVSPQVMKKSMAMLHSAPEHDVPIVEDNDEMADQLRTLLASFDTLKLERLNDRLLIDQLRAERLTDRQKIKELEGRITELEEQVTFWRQGVVLMTEYGTKLITERSQPPKKDAPEVAHPAEEQAVPQIPAAPAVVSPAATPVVSPVVTPVGSPLRSNQSAGSSPQTPASPVSPKRVRSSGLRVVTRSKSRIRMNF